MFNFIPEISATAVLADEHKVRLSNDVRLQGAEMDERGTG
jgi:hypothetical protein